MDTPRNRIDYTNQTMSEIMADIDSARAEFMPEYTDRSDTDFGNQLIKIMAMMADVMSWKIDYTINEAIPVTAVTRRAMYKHCKWKGYRPRSNRAAETTMEFTIMNYNGESVNIPKGFRVTMEFKVNGEYIPYETMEDINWTPPQDAEVGQTFTVQVNAVQGETVSETIGYSDGTMDEEFYIRMSPYIEGSLQIEAYDPTSEASIYFAENENRSFVGTSPDDRVCVLETVDLDEIKVRFGDGYNGALLPYGNQLIAHYRIGGGSVGNRPVGSINTALDSLPYNVIRIQNITEASGGTDAETVEEIKQAIAKGRDHIIYSLMRKQDYENFLANRADRIEKFLVAQDPIDPLRFFRPIVLYLKPWNRLFFTEAENEALLAEIEPYRLMEDEVRISGCPYSRIYCHVKVAADKLYQKESVEQAVRYAICDFIENMKIGDGTSSTTIYLDDLRTVIRGVEGVARYIATVEFCNYSQKGQNIAEDRPLEVGELLFFHEPENDLKVEVI